MRNQQSLRVIATMLASACSAEEVIDLRLTRSSPGGKADFASLDVPLHVPMGGAEQFRLESDGPFEIQVEQMGSIESVANSQIEVWSQADTRSWTSNSSVNPNLTVDLLEGSSTKLIIIVRNADDVDLNGRLHAERLPQNPQDPCSDELYTPWLSALQKQLDDAGAYIEPGERQVIESVLAAKPCASTSDTAFEHWLAWFRQRFDAAGAYFEAHERDALNYVVKARPAADGSSAYGGWFVVWTATFSNMGAYIEQHEKAWLDLLEEVRPAARDDASYLTWLEQFALISNSTGGYLERHERERLDAAIRVKPCAQETTATYQLWLAWLESVTADVHAYSQRARATTCN